ncbi:MAG: TIM barrel protein [bacterium]|nr:TIM barrel protein [bacterium]
MDKLVSRRVFLATASVAATASITSGAVAAKQGPQVCAFSKHLQFIKDFKRLGKTYKDLGLDGVDLTVRKGGHLLPEDVEKELPKAVDAIRGEGVDVCMITTRLNSGDDPDARPILETASKLGIRYFRVGGLKYSKDGDVLTELDQYTEQLRGLAQVAADCGMVAGYHNHSGHDQVGAPLWDLRQAIDTIDLDSFGSNFDVGHATVEGGYGAWRVNARMMAPRVKMMAVKDFVWDKGRPRWVPFGEGHVDTVEILKIMRQAGFAGPISIHVEYKVASDDQMIEEIHKANVTLRDAMNKAGYA